MRGASGTTVVTGTVAQAAKSAQQGAERTLRAFHGYAVVQSPLASAPIDSFHEREGHEREGEDGLT